MSGKKDCLVYMAILLYGYGQLCCEGRGRRDCGMWVGGGWVGSSERLLGVLFWSINIIGDETMHYRVVGQVVGCCLCLCVCGCASSEYESVVSTWMTQSFKYQVQSTNTLGLMSCHVSWYMMVHGLAIVLSVLRVDARGREKAERGTVKMVNEKRGTSAQRHLESLGGTCVTWNFDRVTIYDSNFDFVNHSLMGSHQINPFSHCSNKGTSSTRMLTGDEIRIQVTGTVTRLVSSSGRFSAPFSFFFAFSFLLSACAPSPLPLLHILRLSGLCILCRYIKCIVPELPELDVSHISVNGAKDANQMMPIYHLPVRPEQPEYRYYRIICRDTLVPCTLYNTLPCTRMSFSPTQNDDKHDAGDAGVRGRNGDALARNILAQLTS